jgi:hypothetical protein
MRRRGEKEGHLEEAARLINRAFTSCMTDRYGFDGVVDLVLLLRRHGSGGRISLLRCWLRLIFG